MTDLFSERCGDLLTGSYDCVDRIVLNAVRKPPGECPIEKYASTPAPRWTVFTSAPPLHRREPATPSQRSND